MQYYKTRHGATSASLSGHAPSLRGQLTGFDTGGAPPEILLTRRENVGAAEPVERRARHL